MKNTQNGFVGVAVIILITLVVIGGGTYIYSQKKVKLENQKTFTQAAGVYSVNYPSDWTYSEGLLAARFQTVKEGGSQTFDLRLGTDLDSLTKTLSQQSSGEEVTIKLNTFTKFTYKIDSDIKYVYYILPIGVTENQSTYLSVIIEGFTKIDQSDLNSFLGSIKVYPSKATVIVKKQDNAISDSQIKANLYNFRPGAELYFDSSHTYVGICEGTNNQAKAVAIDKILASTLKTVSAKNIYCNASANAYVYSARNLSGDVMCVDSTGFAGTISTSAKVLSCK